MEEHLRQDIMEIKSNVTELVKQGAEHNTILKEHQRRSLALEALVMPMYSDTALAKKVLKGLGMIVSGIAIKIIADRIMRGH